MKYLPFLLFLIAATAASADPADQCRAVLTAESVRAMSPDELKARRQQIEQGFPKAATEAVCESSASITYEGYQQQLERALVENRDAGNADYDPAELYFFLQCGEGQVNLSPLAYHAFNLNRDEYGFLGQVTLAITWMSTGYLDIRDPDYDRSFMDIVDRVLNYARKEESEIEIQMYEQLLEEIEGYREDYAMMVEECRKTASG